MRRRTLFETKVEGGLGSNAKATDIVFANKNDGSLIIVENDKWNLEAYPKATFEPIGIVVIPGEHGVLKDGSGTVNQCGVMSLVPMNYSTPEKGGTSNQYMHCLFGNDNMTWDTDNNFIISGKSDGLGRYDSTTNGLTVYKAIVTTDEFSSNTANGYSKSTTTLGKPGSHIPVQTTVGGETIGTSPFSPSPYAGEGLNTGPYNESYGLKDGVIESEENNALSDFKGIVNTKIITDIVTGQSNWRTASTITNGSSKYYHPAACCCARFKTTGTKAFVDCTTEELKNGTGFWYLPAIGELGYISPRFADINDMIGKLKTAYGIGVSFNSSNNFPTSSSIALYGYPFFSNFAIGWIKSTWKVQTDGPTNNTYPVRAFMRL